MSEAVQPPNVHSRYARALLAGAVVGCPVCGKPLQGRQQACSGKCRAAKSRRRRPSIPLEDLRGLRALLTETLERLTEIQRDAGTMLERLWEARVEVDRLLGGIDQ